MVRNAELCSAAARTRPTGPPWTRNTCDLVASLRLRAFALTTSLQISQNSLPLWRPNLALSLGGHISQPPKMNSTSDERERNAMKNQNPSRPLATGLFTATLLLACVASTLAAVHYVDVNSTNATLSYTARTTTAATIIQYAVDAAVAGQSSLGASPSVIKRSLRRASAKSNFRFGRKTIHS